MSFRKDANYCNRHCTHPFRAYKYTNDSINKAFILFQSLFTFSRYQHEKLFFPYELQKNGDIDILQTKSCDNLADLFTKSLPTAAYFKNAFMALV
jgi:hypothetical protein